MRVLSVMVLLFALSGVLPAEANTEDRYLGSPACAECHARIYAEWLASGHHMQLRKADEARQTRLVPPQGYAWEDISYVIGGTKSKAVFVDKKGYLITAAKDGSPAKTQYNVSDGSWSDYFPGEKKPYDCAFCHTTGYQPDGKQDGLPGIVGRWQEDGIGCEICHGPGDRHVKDPAKRSIDRKRSEDICERCHQRGGIDPRPLKDIGLVRHHEQINELKAGAHSKLKCLNCHNPHQRAVLTKYNCIICHSRAAMDYEESIHGQSGLKCIECHMARLPKAAISRASYIGRVRTHLFRVESGNSADMFTVVEERGVKSTFTRDFVAVEYACLTCHENRGRQWALDHSRNFHRRHQAK